LKNKFDIADVADCQLEFVLSLIIDRRPEVESSTLSHVIVIRRREFVVGRGLSIAVWITVIVVVDRTRLPLLQSLLL